MSEIQNQVPKGESRQRRWSLRCRAEGLCILCGQPAEPSERDPRKKTCYCLKHKIQHREYQRQRLGIKRPNKISKQPELPRPRRETVHLRNAGGKPFCGYSGTRMSEDWAEINCEICWRLWHK